MEEKRLDKEVMYNFFKEHECKFSFAETIEQITQEIAVKNWKLLATHDLQATMIKNGYEVLPITVLELCTPRISSKILTKDDERAVSNLMPCRISVYQKSDGKTYISVLNAPLVASQIGGVVNEAMSLAFTETEAIIHRVI